MVHAFPNISPGLLREVSQGSQAAFRQLVDACWRNVYGHALAYTHSDATAEELTQDIFLKIWMARGKLTTVDHFQNYLFIIARNALVNELRKKLEYVLEEDADGEEEDIWLPDRQLEYKETYSLLMKGIEELPPARRQIFKMSRLDGLTYEEIGAQLQISRNTTKEHIVKSLHFLRIYVSRHQEKVISGLLIYLLKK